MVDLTPHQQDAIAYLLAGVGEGKPLVALRGLAGTGKTTLVPALREALEKQGFQTVVGSPTHRAAMILRRKGIDDADTVHSHALTPTFKADYRRALAWLGDSLTQLSEDEPQPDVEGLPWLIYEAVKPDLERGKALRRHGKRYKAKRLLQSVGISGKDHFAGFGPKAGNGVLIIDEASMVGQQMLDICQRAFRQIILIGDPGQLPPVKDTAVLREVEGTDLTEIHRQAQDSPLIQLAYQAREGEEVWLNIPRTHPDIIQSAGQAPARTFLDAPLLVWRNQVRIECTHAIREALGFHKPALYPSEPLVCRSTSEEDRAEGFYNNGLYRIVAVEERDPRALVVEDAMGETSTIIAHLEELDGDKIDPKAIPFRFGYCLTVHTAQGGEWPLVYISWPDLVKYAGFAKQHDRETDVAQWTYTAITRAKEHLCFLTQHRFLGDDPMAAPKAKPPSAPFLNMADPREAALDSMEATREDDLPDVAVPDTLQEAMKTDMPAKAPSSPQVASGATALPGEPSHALNALHGAPDALPGDYNAHEALLQGFCQHLLKRVNEHITASAREADRNVQDMYDYTKRQLDIEREKLRHAETVLDQLITHVAQQGLQVRHDPYVATVKAFAPEGYPISIQVAKAGAAELIDALPALMGWLTDNQYRAEEKGTM